MRGLSIRLRVGAVMTATLLAVGLAGSALVGRILEHNVEVAAGEALWRAAATFRALERGEVEKMSATLDALVAREDLRRAFLRRDREELLRLGTPTFRDLQARDGITHWYFVDPQRVCVLRIHRPELHGDLIDRPSTVKAAQTRQVAAGMELGRTNFALRVVRPYFDGGRLIGYMELSEEIDRFLKRMKEGTGDDFGLLVKKEALDRAVWESVQAPWPSTWDDRKDVVLVDATSYGQGIIDYQGDLDAVPAGGKMLEDRVEGDRAHIRGIFPVDDVAGRRVGALFVRHEITALHRAIASSRLQGRLAVFAAALLVSALLFVVVDGMVLSRVARLSRISEALSSRLPAGSLRAGPQVITSSGDQLTRLEGFFRRFPDLLDGAGPPGKPPGKP